MTITNVLLKCELCSLDAVGRFADRTGLVLAMCSSCHARERQAARISAGDERAIQALRTELEATRQQRDRALEDLAIANEQLLNLRQSHAVTAERLQEAQAGLPIARIPQGVDAAALEAAFEAAFEAARPERLVLMDVVDPRIAAIEDALREALNRWEWFAQRFRDRIGGLAAADEHDYPRIRELRKLAGDA